MGRRPAFAAGILFLALAAQAALPASDDKDGSLLKLVQGGAAPGVSSGEAVKLTPEQEADLIQASMRLEDGMIEDLRREAIEWSKTMKSDGVGRLMRERLEALSSDARYKALFGERPVEPAAGPDVWDQTVRAYQFRARPKTPRYEIPSSKDLVEAIRRGEQPSGAVRSAGSAQEVFDGNKASFEEVCRKYSSADQEGGAGFPRAILGIMQAETNFGAGCDKSRSATCGYPSPVRRAMNGAQRNAAYRIGKKGMFGPWAATTAPASSAGAAGICQFLPGTAEMHLKTLNKDFGKDSADLFSFGGCIPMIAIYLKDYLGSHKTRRPGIENAIRAYNGGAGFKENNRETKGYHKKVTESMKGQSGVPETCGELLQQSGSR